ncbi:MAG: glycosyl hydrolase family protein [Marinilabiliales bacterium]|nr:MAG: glycosyl hydrolase family protein [Marinilabiliales bacterium]
MSNFMLKFKFGLKSRLGMLTGTSRIEAQNTALKQEYEEFLSYEESKEPQRFDELEEIVTSQDFRDRKKFINNQRFKGSDAHEKFKEYNSMKRSPEFKGYFRFIGSNYFPDFKKFDNSPEINKIDANREEDKDEIATLRKSPGINAYYKLAKKKDLTHYRKIDGSPELEKFRELEEYVNSDEFKKTREYLEMKDKFSGTPEHQQEKEYLELKKSKKLKWYHKAKASGKFDEVKKWKLEFEDDFSGKSLDGKKWLTTYFWGKELLKEGYSVASDLHFYTEGKNHEVADKLLKLHTRREPVTGQAWDPALGFFPKDFEFTSGLVNTGASFRQKYGAFEAKVRMHRAPSVWHAFWMLSEQMVPHVDVFRFSGKKRNRIEFNNYWTSNGDKQNIRKSSETVGGIDFAKGFFIFRLEWYPGMLVWKINNTVVKKITQGIPQEPMYILFSSGVDSEDGNGLPTSMDIDWVRGYNLAEETAE